MVAVEVGEAEEGTEEATEAISEAGLGEVETEEVG